MESNLSYIVPSYTLEVNEARKKAGLKTATGENIQQSPYKPKRIAAALSTIPLQSGIIFKCTIWTHLPEKSMIRGGPTQWWNTVLTQSVDCYSDSLQAQAEKHAGWKERPQRDNSLMDINTMRPILIGLMEAKGNGDPTTISVPEGGGTWHDLFCLIPNFLGNSPPEIPRGSKKSSTTGLLTNQSIAIVLPVIFKPTTQTPTSVLDLQPIPATIHPIALKKLTVRERESKRKENIKTASKARENIFVKKSTRRRSQDIKKIESESDNERKETVIMKKEISNSTSVQISNIQPPVKLERIIQNPIPATNTFNEIIPKTPPKSMIIGRLKRSRSIVSPPSLKNLGNRKPKRGREFDAVRDAIIDHQLD